MSMAGKILAVFNVLAALVAFIYFLPTDWGTRQSWAYSYYRHELILDGLPLDKEQKDTEGYLLVDKMSDTTKKQIFQSAGSPVNTQMEEIDRVRGVVEGAGDERKQEILANLARTGQERDDFRAKLPENATALIFRLESLLSIDLPQVEPTRFDASTAPVEARNFLRSILNVLSCGGSVRVRLKIQP